MQKRLTFFVVILLFAAINSFSQISPANNPLLVHSNDPILFSDVNALTIKQAVTQIINTSDNRVKKIITIPAKARTTANTLMAFDKLGYDITDLSAKLGLIASTYENDSTRNEANNESERLSVYANTLYLNEDLYKAITQFAKTPSAKTLKPNQQKFLKETIIAFEKNGMKLTAAGRKEMQVLNEKLIAFGLQFDKNIAESRDSVEFSEDDLRGVPANTKAPWKRANGKYIVVVNGPNYTEVMSNADNSETRHTMYLHYNNRAYPKNVQVLDSLILL